MKSTLKNRTIFTRDNLEVMRGMADECVDLIYLDPPFNSNHDYSAPIGSQAAGAEFKDTWSLNDIDLAWHGEIESEYPGLYKLLEATKLIHGKSMMAYLIYMAVRIIEMKRILKNGGGAYGKGGSIYLHCDPTASHYLKLLMDEVFGKKNFRNEIAWCYTGPSNTKRWFPRKHDVILFYVNNNTDYMFNSENIRVDYKSLNIQHALPGDTGIGGKLTKENVHEYRKAGKIPEDWWPDFSPVGRLKKERIGYPTQKPLKLLERIIQASSNEGDMVLDPFCGCATTCVAAEKLNREWVGIDISPKAAELVKERINNELGLLLLNPIHRTDIPSDRGGKRSRDIKNVLYGKQEGVCGGCRHWYRIKDFEVDHITPRSKGGPDTDENLQLLCGNCNRIKGDKSQEYLISRIRSLAG